MFPKEVIVLLFSLILQCLAADFIIPPITLEAFTPMGFRATMQHLDGIQLFAFHCNVNKDITQVDPGQYSESFTKPVDNVWVYYNKDLSLKKGDVIHYWVFVQYQKLGYRKDSVQWTVPELLNIDDTTCEGTPSIVDGKARVCKNHIIFQDEFEGSTIDISKWRTEEYIPTDPDWEFNSYQVNVCTVSANKLTIKPTYARSENDVRGVLDLRQKCTRQSEENCYKTQQTVFILPPATSGKLVSLTAFRYGKIEIKAKLPGGDWMYPQIYLQQEKTPSRKLWIAYARGNNRLIANSQEDIGSRLLFGGPVLQPREPIRSTHLKSKRGNVPFSNDFHNYTVIWNSDYISLMLDGNEYGRIPSETMQQIKFAEDDMVRLVLGIGIGGVNDFPDDFRSGSDGKPWHNNERAQLRKFFEARNTWSQTWNDANGALQVESVKITAL